MSAALRPSVLRRELQAAAHIPYTALVSDTVVRTAQGDYVQVFQLAGASFESADDATLNTWHGRLNVLWRNVASPQVALWSHLIRRRERAVGVTGETGGFAGGLEEKYRARLGQELLMVNELYLTLIYRPAAGMATSWASRLLKRTAPKESQLEVRDALDACEKLSQTVRASLDRYDPEPLGVYRRGPRVYSRVLEFLNYLVSGEARPVPLPRAPVNEVLGCTRLLFGFEAIEYRLPEQTRVGAMLGIKEYPTLTAVGMFDRLLAVPFPFALTQSFTFLTKAAGQALLQRQMNRMANAGDFAVSQAEELGEALDALTSNEFVMGDHHFSLQVLAETPEDGGKDLGEQRLKARRTPGRGGWRKAPLRSSASRTRAAMTDLDLEELRAELNEFAQPAKRDGRSARAERIIAGFEEIQRFVEKHGRPPQHGEERDIFERLYAVRLDRIRSLEECRPLLAPLDHQGLLAGMQSSQETPGESIDEDELLAELRDAAGSNDITELRHVRTSAEKRAAEEIANRTVCTDFETFKPVFAKVQRELKSGVRQTRPFQTRAMDEIQKGAFFVVGGQIAYIAEVGEEFTTQYERRDSRLRVIYDNGTESDVLQRSLQRALHRDAAARFITDPNAGPLFADTAGDDDLESGTIYVLRSKSDHPVVAANRNVLHKIGVTGGEVSARIANAKLDPTYLMADVEVVTTYKLYNINRIKLENLIHRVFDSARLDIGIKDRFGNSVTPREWFLVPAFVVDEVVGRIKNGTITDYVYDSKVARLVRAR